MWCIPPKQSAEFVFHMEDVLEVYRRAYDARHPVVCLDETLKQLIGETRLPLPAKPGAVERYDHVYVRNGVASLFLACEPLAGWRHVAVTEHRRRTAWAHVVRDLLEGRYREDEKVVLVMDQLNTHSPASLYEAFPPAEAKRLADRLELHHTPKHGSWLNMAEIGLARWPSNAWPAAWSGRPPWSSGFRAGRTPAMPPALTSTGSSPPTTPASSSAAYTHQFSPESPLVRGNGAYAGSRTHATMPRIASAHSHSTTRNTRSSPVRRRSMVSRIRPIAAQRASQAMRRRVVRERKSRIPAG